MKYKLKCMVSTVLTLSITATSIIFPIHTDAAEDTYLTPDVAILENILNGDRHFVIDTLIGTNYKTDFSTNPHAIVNYIGNENTMMDNVLSQYQNKDDPNYSAAYKAAVDIMEKIYNSDEYAASAADFIADYAADLMSVFGLDASSLIDNMSYSKSQLNYESILKETLSADYTASDGTELSTKEIELENLERINKGIKNLKTFADFFKSNASANHMNDDTFDDRMKYYNDYLIPYTDNMSGVLSAFSDMQDSKGKSDERKKEDMVNFVTFLSMLNQMDRYEHANEDVESDIVYYAPTFFVSDETLKVLKTGDKAISTVSKTLSTFMFIESIATQSDSMKGALTRMSRTANPSLKPVLTTFANEIGEAGNQKLIGYESLMKYLRDAGAVKELEQWAGKKITKKISKYLPQSLAYSNAGLAKTAVSKALSDATAVVGISSWCADKTMSFGDTCKKTYELKYLRTLIAQAIVTYQDDLAVYQSDKTEENAKAVLDDLLLIQKLRLRGETIAYKMTEGQWNSPLGRLLATGTLNADEMLMDYLDKAYQARVDAFIGASAMPLSTNSLTIGNGEKLSVSYRNDAGLYGNYTKADGTMYSIGELNYRIANGITVNSGGQLIAGMTSFYTPYIENRGGTITIKHNARSLSELIQSSGTTTFGDGEFLIDSIELTGGTINSESSAIINCGDLETSGTPTVEQITFKADNAKLNGTLENFNIYVNGDLSGSGTVDNLTISGNGAQDLGGSLTVTNLTYTNSGTATQSGTIYVSETVQNTSSKVDNGQNTVLKSSGDIAGSYYNSSITLDGTTLTSEKTINGSLLTKNTVNIGDTTVSGLLKQTSGTLNLNGDITAKTDAYFSGTVNQNNSAFYAYGDISGNNITLGNLTMCGKAPQKIDDEITVNNFHNKSKQLTVNDTVTVTGSARSESPPVNGKNIKMTDRAYFGDTYYNGDITVNGLTGSLPKNLRGKLYLTGNITHTGSSSIGSMEHSAGTLTITNGELTVKGLLINSSSSANVLINSGSVLNAMADTSIKGTVQNDGIFNVCGDLYNSGSASIGNLNITAKAPLTVSGNTLTVTNLNISGNSNVTLSAKINISGKYSGNNHIINPENVVFTNGNTPSNNVVYNEPLNVTGDLIIDGHTVTARGLTVTNGDVILTNGGKLIVNGKTNISGSSDNKISIDKTSSMELNKLSFIKSIGNIEVNGNLKFGGDISLSSTTISGSGTVAANADIYGSSLTINKPKNFNITGKTPQTIECSGANFDNLTISNPCKSGVTFSGTVYCYGALNTGNTKINGTITEK